MQIGQSSSGNPAAVSNLRNLHSVDLAPRDADLALGERLEQNSLGKITDQSDELQTKFQDFVGQTVFGSMLKSMRSTVDKASYFNGGQTEEIFQSQLDTVLTEELTKSSAAAFSDPMFELFQLNRR